MRQPIPLIGSSAPDDNEPFGANEYINCAPTVSDAPGSYGESMIVGLPGCQEHTTGPGRWRGLRNVEGRRFGVSGTSFVQLYPDGGYDVLGEVPGTSRCSLSHNQIAGGNEVVIGNGSAGFSYKTTDGSFEVITDASFPGAIQFDYINSLFVYLFPQRRKFGNSSLADGREYNALESYEGESSPDRIRAIKVFNNEVWALGERTFDVFQNTGATNALFQRIATGLDRGCAATHSVCVLDNSLFFLTDEGQVHRTEGYSTRRISSRAMEQKIARSDMSKAFAYTWVDRGFAVYYITFPDGDTWGYDCAASARAGFPVWHKRASGPEGDRRWRFSCMENFDGQWYGGEYNSGRLMRLDWDYHKEGTEELCMRWKPGALHAQGKRVRLHEIGLMVDSGHASVPATLSVYPPMEGTTLCEDTPTHQFQSAGGVGPYTYWVEGDLPDGQSMDNDGLVTGTRTTAGTFVATIHSYDYGTESEGTMTQRVVVSECPPVYFSFNTSEVDATTAGYASLNPHTNVLTEIATTTFVGSQATGHAPVQFGNRLVAKCEFDNVNSTPDQESGLHLLAYDGTTTLVKKDQWQYSAAEDHDYCDHCAFDDETVAVVLQEGVDLHTMLCAVSVTDDALTTLGTPLQIDASSTADYAVCMIGTTLIVLRFDSTEGNRSLRAYTAAAGAWTLAGTYGSALTGSFGATLSPMGYNGTYLALSNGMVFTYAAGTFTLYATAALSGTGQFIGWVGNVGIWQDGTTALKAFVIAGNAATLDATLTQTVVAASRGVMVGDGKFIVPGTTSQPDANSGVFQYETGAITRLAALELTGGATYAGMGVIEALTDD